ncbi:MAG: hypothetical protein ACRELY_32675 [Polyangiaceae bacterium]
MLARRKILLVGGSLFAAAAGVLMGCPASFPDLGPTGDETDGASQDGPVVPPGCDLTKDPKDSAACVDDSIGIFVSASGSDSNVGSKASPMKTIGAALGKITSQHVRVYVCDGTYAEPVKVTSAVGIYGGFACADWSYASTLPKVGPATTGYALDVENVSGAVVVEDLELDAPAGQNPGDSSIAVFVSQSTNVLLRRVTAKSGDGAAGADAVATSNYDADAGAALTGNNASGDIGGLTKDCSPVCANAIGSLGGQGGQANMNGADGGPPTVVSASGHDGQGGIQPGCNIGPHQGADAPAADGGASGAARAGSLSASGWQSEQAAIGLTAAPGQGGGGGGGGSAAASTGGGGGGGCGGCGGEGGGDGGSGGSSFAILVFQSTITADACTLETGGGGAGKPGGTAQGGQAGGFKGSAVPTTGTGCDGAPGGAGGAGAGGGGGAGGNAIAIGYVGSKPTVSGGTMQEGNAGAHGGGGTGAQDNDGNPGADGIKADLQQLQ